MKTEMVHKAKLFSVFFILSILLFSRQAYSQATFVKKVMDVGHPNATAQCKDGGYISLTFWRRVFSPESSPLLIRKLDRSGRMEWEKKLFFKGEQITLFDRISQTNDGGYLITGSGTIIKLRSNGEILWAKSLQLPVSAEAGVYFDHVSSLNNSGFILSGQYVHPEGEWTAWTAPVVVKLNSSGNVVSASRFEHPEITGLEYFSQRMVVTPDGGSYFARTSEMNSGRVILIRSDAKGKIVWSKRYEIRNFTFQTAASTSDNGAIIAGTDAESGKQVCLLKLNSNGQIDWNERFALNRRASLTQLIQDSDGGYLATGSLIIDNGSMFGTTRAFLLKTDGAGKVVFATMFRGSDASYGASIFSTSDKRIFLFGSYGNWIPNSNAETMLILKLNSNGIVPGCQLLASIKSSRRQFSDVKITNLKVSQSKLSLSEITFDGSITSQSSASEVSTECQ